MSVLDTFEKIDRHSAARSHRIIFATVAAILATTIFLVVGVCMLPHDRYLRFKSSTAPEFAKYGWIYERIHFDKRPIDVAFIGSSCTMLAVNSALVEQSFADASGHAMNVVNFSHADPGRDMDYLIARELMENARPRLLVIEVGEIEGGRLHPAFESLAEPSDLLKAPLLVNSSYFTNLLHLPSRQLSLSVRTMAPEPFGDSVQFNPATYRGLHWDNPELEIGGSFRPNVYDSTTSESELKANQLRRAKVMWAPNPHLPLAIQAELRRLKPRASLIYVAKVLDLAKQLRVPVRFLHLPAWREHAAPMHADFYQRHAPMWSYPGDVDRIDWWYDSIHLNRNGSIAFSDWLGKRLAEDLQNEQPASAR
ncbi:MAG TPA: hypothetical protein VGU20_21755 [Stellaceae bacterium]|nr:hypothetical protein [Stellaceae bacterium]